MNTSPTQQIPPCARANTSTRAVITGALPRKTRRRWLIAGTGVAISLAAFAAFSSGLGDRASDLVADGYNEARVTLLLDHMLGDASAAQKAEVGAIVKRTVSEVKAVRAMNQTNRHDVLAVLTQAKVDRVALEALRVQQMATLDDASRLAANGLADASEVLTPEQRLAVAYKLEAHWK